MERSKRDNAKAKKSKYKENELIENESNILTIEIEDEQLQREKVLNKKKKAMNAYELVCLQVDGKLERKQTLIE